MSISLPLTDFYQSSQVTDIHQALYIKIKKFQPGFNGKFQNFSTKSEGFYCYWVDHDNKKIHLPYMLAQKLFKVEPRKATYPACPMEFYGTPRPEQESIIDELLEQLNQHGTSFLHVYTSAGKTFLGVYISACIGKYTIIMHNATTLSKQWAKSYENFTNAQVVIVTAKNASKLNRQQQVFICTKGMVKYLPAWLKTEVGLLILDEMHTLCVQSAVEPILSLTPQYVLACTATPKTDGSEDMARAIIGLHSIRRKLPKAFTVYQYQTGLDIPTPGQGVEKWQAYLRNATLEPARNAQIIALVLANLQRKILILCRRQDHVETLAELLKDKVTTDTMYGTKKTYQDSAVLIGTSDKIGVGFDEANACDDYQGRPIDLVILTIGCQSHILLEQMVGRGMRSNQPIIIDLVDDNKLSHKHWLARKKWYSGCNSVISPLSYPGVITDPNLLLEEINPALTVTSLI